MTTRQAALVTLHLGGGERLEVVVTDDIWFKDPHPNTIWGLISYRISKGTITEERLTNGVPVIVNWSHVSAISYVNPSA